MLPMYDILFAVLTCSGVPFEGCKAPLLFYKEAPYRQADCSTITSFYRGCKKYYGKDSCVAKVLKTGQYSFIVTCKTSS